MRGAAGPRLDAQRSLRHHDGCGTEFPESLHPPVGRPRPSRRAGDRRIRRWFRTTRGLLGQVGALPEAERGKQGVVDVGELDLGAHLKNAKKQEELNDVGDRGDQRDQKHLKVADIGVSGIVKHEVSGTLRAAHRLLQSTEHAGLRQGILFPLRDGLGPSEGKGAQPGKGKQVVGDAHAAEQQVAAVAEPQPERGEIGHDHHAKPDRDLEL